MFFFVENFEGKALFKFDNLVNGHHEIASLKNSRNISKTDFKSFSKSFCKPFLNYYETSAWRCLNDEEYEYVEQGPVSLLDSSVDRTTVAYVTDNHIKIRKIIRGVASSFSSDWRSQIVI